MSLPDIFRQSLKPAADCPSLEKLGLYLDGVQPELESHVKSCANCEAELTLMHEFLAADMQPAEASAVHFIVEKLSARPLPWWKRMFQPAAAQGWAMAASMLVLVAVGANWLNSRDVQVTKELSTQEMRAGREIKFASESGDLKNLPRVWKWQAVSGTARYDLHLLEVDGTPIWQASVESAEFAINKEIASLMVPRKTVFLTITAVSREGIVLGDSGQVRMRLVQ